MSMATLTFLGATGTVTGSKYVLEAAGERLMIPPRRAGSSRGRKSCDCGTGARCPCGPRAFNGWY